MYQSFAQDVASVVSEVILAGRTKTQEKGDSQGETTQEGKDLFGQTRDTILGVADSLSNIAIVGLLYPFLIVFGVILFIFLLTRLFRKKESTPPPAPPMMMAPPMQSPYYPPPMMMDPYQQ